MTSQADSTIREVKGDKPLFSQSQKSKEPLTQMNTIGLGFNIKSSIEEAKQEYQNFDIL